MSCYSTGLSSKLADVWRFFYPYSTLQSFLKFLIIYCFLKAKILYNGQPPNPKLNPLFLGLLHNILLKYVYKFADILLTDQQTGLKT